MQFCRDDGPPCIYIGSPYGETHANYTKIHYDIGSAIGYLTDGDGSVGSAQMVGITML